MHYGISRQVSYSFDEAVDKVTAALQKEGFGVLSTIDIQAKMKEKLDKDMDKYVILGACHPASAYKALQSEQEIGLLLPCNVIVYEKGEEVFVSAIKPSMAMGFLDNPDVNCIMKEIEPKLERVVQTT